MRSALCPWKTTWIELSTSSIQINPHISIWFLASRIHFAKHSWNRESKHDVITRFTTGEHSNYVCLYPGVVIQVSNLQLFVLNSSFIKKQNSAPPEGYRVTLKLCFITLDDEGIKTIWHFWHQIPKWIKKKGWGSTVSRFLIVATKLVHSFYDLYYSCNVGFFPHHGVIKEKGKKKRKRLPTLPPSPPWWKCEPGEWTGEVVGELGRMFMRSGSTMSLSNRSKMPIPSDPSAGEERNTQRAAATVQYLSTSEH